jgi:ubiquinone/menaquinone biosynthesis C-methylase UbiE
MTRAGPHAEPVHAAGQRELVQQQFGGSAAAYATSTVHATGRSLARLVDLLSPQPDWRVLDLATAAGHTAFAFAPFVAQVVAADLTEAMLTVAAGEARQRGLAQVVFCVADVGAQPFPAGRFELVTCRIAAHHFPDIGRFLAEAARVLAPGGRLALVDNVVPGSHLRGKKGDRLRAAGRYVNAFERLRDPSHGRCLSHEDWRQHFDAAGFALEGVETLEKEIDLDEWAARLRVPAGDRVRLRVMLRQAPDAVAEFLRPRISGDRLAFTLTEGLFIGRRA